MVDEVRGVRVIGRLGDLPVRHSRGCPGAVVCGVGILVDLTLPRAEVVRRVRWLTERLEEGSEEKVFRSS